MTGKLILVSGYSGAGKTTLVRRCLSQINNLVYFTTMTTRKPRNDDERATSYEYDFVTDKTYEEKKSNSSNWIHHEIYGKKYGNDRGYLYTGVQNGVNFILNIAPTVEVITRTKNEFNCDIVSVFINTPKGVSASRLHSERPESEHRRANEDANLDTFEVICLFDHLFEPCFILEFDQIRFCELIKSLLK